MDGLQHVGLGARRVSRVAGIHRAVAEEGGRSQSNVLSVRHTVRGQRDDSSVRQEPPLPAPRPKRQYLRWRSSPSRARTRREHPESYPFARVKES